MKIEERLEEMEYRLKLFTVSLNLQLTAIILFAISGGPNFIYFVGLILAIAGLISYREVVKGEN